MKDWKADLLSIKAKSNNKASPVKNTSVTTVTFSPNPNIALSAQLEPIEIKILQLIRNIEGLNINLEKVAPYPLVKGNSKLIKKYQQDIKVLKTQATELIFKLKPYLLSGTKLPNTNALLIETKDELISKEEKYQNALLAQGRIKLEKDNQERIKRLAVEEASKKERQDQLRKKALSAIKEFDIHTCNKCDDGYILITCPECTGTGRTSSAHKGVIVERFICGNLRPNCEICGGLGFFSKEKEVMTYECNACSGGKSLIRCKTCGGTKLMAGNGNSFPKCGFTSILKSEQELIDEIKSHLTS